LGYLGEKEKAEGKISLKKKNRDPWDIQVLHWTAFMAAVKSEGEKRGKFLGRRVQQVRNIMKKLSLRGGDANPD